ASSSEKTATVATPISAAVRAIRTAISPRLAMSSFFTGVPQTTVGTHCANRDENAKSLLSPAKREGERLCRQAGLQGVWALRMALRMVSSFRMQAVMASFGGLPADLRRWWKARMAGLQRMAATVTM